MDRRWRALRAERLDLDAHALAARLSVSEVDIAAARCAAGEATALQCNVVALVEAIGRLGVVTARTGNASASLETRCIFREARFDECGTGLVSGPNIDLRLLSGAWRYAFALEDRRGRATRHTLAVYGNDGAPLHSIELGSESDLDAYRRMIASFGRPELPDFVETAVPRADDDDVPDISIDVVRFRAALAALRDPAAFASLLREFGLRREQGLRLAGTAFARQLAPDVHRQLLFAAHAMRLPITLLVASGGAVQVARSSVPRPLLGDDGSLSLMRVDAGFHLTAGAIARTWIVCKPSPNGSVTSLESYGARGNLVFQVFGDGHGPRGECVGWRSLLARFATAPVFAHA